MYFINSNFRKISKNLILNVVKARLDEIFEMLKKQLVIPGFNFNSGINFLLTGEITNITNLEKYSQNFFGSTVSKIYLSNTKDHGDVEQNFASCLGALKIIKDGWETEAYPKIKEKNMGKIGFFDKIFDRH